MSTKGGATRIFVETALATETDECILWPYGLHKSGYPSAKNKDGKQYRPHRLVCELAHGAPPKPGMHASHKCGIRRCVNKRHIIWETPKQNNARKQDHGTHIRWHQRRLTIEQVRSIRAEAAAGRTFKDMAAEIGLSDRAVSKIVTRQSYAEVE